MQSNASPTPRHSTPRSTEGGQKSGPAMLISNGDVTDTKELIHCLRSCQNWAEEDGVVGWLRGCVKWFTDESVASLTLEEVEEYTLLGGLKVKCAVSKQLMKNWFHSICEKVEGRYGDEKVVKCINAALRDADIEIFDSDPTCLIRLADDLLEKLDVEKTTFTKQTYTTHRTALYASEQTLAVIDEVAREQLNGDVVHGVYQKFRDRLKLIMQTQCYYPFCFQAKVIEQRLLILGRDESKSAIGDVSRRVFLGCYGMLCAMEGFRSLAVLEFNHSAFEAALANISASMKSGVIKSAEWYRSILELDGLTMACMTDPEKFDEFASCYKAAIDAAASMPKENRMALRYGIVDKLGLLITQVPNLDIQSAALDLLLSLGERCSEKDTPTDGWCEDIEVFEALLDALCSAHGNLSQEEKRAEVSVCLEIMTKTATSDVVNEKVKGWLAGRTLDEMLEAHQKEEAVNPSDILFALAKNEIQSSTESDELKDLRAEIKKRYQHLDFAKMRSIFDGVPSMHVRGMQQQLMLLEKTDAEIDDGSGSHEREENQSVAYYERLEMIKTEISYRDLFVKRRMQAGQRKQTINKVLILGNPGTGKTSLSHKIAYHWSEDKWGTEFEMVYVLPVRKLRKEEYDDRSIRRMKTLTTAIANVCFKPRDDDFDFCHLRDRVGEDLEKSTTLLVVDGLDEGQSASEEILQMAKCSACKLLLLSRPYKIHHERELVDLEVECAGFNEKQLSSYVRSGLADEKATLLEHFLKSNRSVWEIAHVPVNAHILCFMWKERSDILRRDKVNGSLLKLYRSMTGYIWDRFQEKYKVRNVKREDVFYKLGEIGLDALVQGQILINQELVREHVDDSEVESVLKNCAFLLLELAGSEYQFPHLTFQEYFAGCHMALNLVAERKDERQEAETFISEYKYYGEFRVLLSFMTEEVVRLKGPQRFKDVLKVIDKSSDLLRYQHFLLKLNVVESSLAVTRKTGKHDRRVLAVAEPVVNKAVEFLGKLIKHKQLRSLVAAAMQKVPNVCRSFVKQTGHLCGRSYGVNTLSPEPKQTEKQAVLSQPSTPTRGTPTKLLPVKPSTKEKLPVRSMSEILQEESSAVSTRNQLMQLSSMERKEMQLRGEERFLSSRLVRVDLDELRAGLVRTNPPVCSQEHAGC